MADVPRITEIYNEGIIDRVATFETQLRSEETIRGWIDSRYPIVVVEHGGEIIAWAGTSSYRPRDCYAGIAEFSVYVHRAARGKGAGRVAMQALVSAARHAGFEKLVSRVFVENISSRRLLRSVGFREVGVYERHAQLDGVWRDVVIVELLLQDHEGEPYGALWQPDPGTLSLWSELKPGSQVIIEKVPWESDREPYRYPAQVVVTDADEPWVETEAVWTLDTKDVAGLLCEPGNIFREFYSPRHPFNCFAMYTPDDEFVGWYGNVTKPTRCFRDGNQLIVSWQDLIIDLVMTREDKEPRALDDDELVGSGWLESRPELTQQMIAAREMLSKMLREGFFPTR